LEAGVQGIRQFGTDRHAIETRTEVASKQTLNQAEIRASLRSRETLSDRFIGARNASRNGGGIWQVPEESVCEPVGGNYG
jgi:hypothetical protein